MFFQTGCALIIVRMYIEREYSEREKGLELRVQKKKLMCIAHRNYIGTIW